MIETPLFEDELIQLRPLDPEKDAATISVWSHNPEYLWQLSDDPALPFSETQVKKQLEEMIKEAEKSRSQFNFGIRAREGDQLVGIIRLVGVQWSHGAAQLQFGLGQPEGSGEPSNEAYAVAALKLILHYAFAELNLYRLETRIGEHNARIIALLMRLGFCEEVRRRQAIFRLGRRWDMLHLGILREEWAAASQETSG